MCVFRDNRFTPVSSCQWPKLNTMGRHLVGAFRDSRFAEQDSQPFFPSMAKVKHHGKTAGVCIQGPQIHTSFLPSMTKVNTMGRHLVCVFRDNRFTPVSSCQWPKINTMGRHLVCVLSDSLNRIHSHFFQQWP